MTKQCTKCKQTVALVDFPPSKEMRDGRKSWCKRCTSLRNVESSYGITIDDYYKMLQAQDNRCAICGVHAENAPSRGNKYRTLVVDHDHISGAVRSLLCHTCNVMLGHAKDDESILLSAVTYLRSHKSKI